MQQFYSHGKLMISGEYLVLKGALAMALPLQLGQKMIVETAPGESILHWKSYDDQQSIWADISFSKKDLTAKKDSIINTDTAVVDQLQRILHYCRKMNPSFLMEENTTTISNYLEFNRSAGLGSSSTLINNLAAFAGIDAFELNKIIFGGSGYDIACARVGHPIFYRIDEEGAIFDTVHFSPPQPEQIFFIYLNRKENSQNAVEEFTANAQPYTEEIEIISEITEALLFCDDFDDFMQLLDEHEEIMQFVLQEEKVKTRLFSDFDGVVKSLGAWGGDFVLAASNMEPEKIRAYFSGKGYSIQYAYNELVLS